MLKLILFGVLILLPFIIYFIQHQQATNPSLRWPKLAEMLGLEYKPGPPRMSGRWQGRSVAVESTQAGARASTELLKPSRIRVEVGPRELVTRRAGVVVPDPVPTEDGAFEDKFLARCSDKAAGIRLLDPMLRQRLLGHPAVDFVGQGGAVQWILPEITEPEMLEETLKLMSEIAAEMENYPA